MFYMSREARCFYSFKLIYVIIFLRIHSWRTLIFEAGNIRQDASTCCHKSHALCAMQKYCTLNVVSRNWMFAEVPFISLFLSLLHKAAYACTPAIGVKLAELSIRGTYAVDLIHEKRRPYFQAVLYCKTVLFMALDCESENMTYY